MLQIFSTPTKISWQKVWWNVSFCVRRWESLQLELIENCSPVIEQWCDLRPVFIWPCMLGHHPSSHSQLEQTGDTNMLWPLRTAVLQHCSLKSNWHIFSHFVLKLKQTKCPLFPIILWRSRSLFWRQSACDIWACVISLSQHAALQTLCFQARKPRATRTRDNQIIFPTWQVVVLERFRTVDCQYCDHLVITVINQSRASATKHIFYKVGQLVVLCQQYLQPQCACKYFSCHCWLGCWEARWDCPRCLEPLVTGQPWAAEPCHLCHLDTSPTMT